MITQGNTPGRRISPMTPAATSCRVDGQSPHRVSIQRRGPPFPEAPLAPGTAFRIRPGQAPERKRARFATMSTRQAVVQLLLIIIPVLLLSLVTATDGEKR